MNPLAAALAAVPILLAAAVGIVAPDGSPAAPADVPPAPVPDAGAPADDVGERRFDLLLDTSGDVRVTLPAGATGTATAVLSPHDVAVRSDRPLCLSLERVLPDEVVLERAGQCGLNVSVQTDVEFGSDTLLEVPLDGLPAGTYRLGFTGEPQAAYLDLALEWGS